jgi:hypothetical protein
MYEASDVVEIGAARELILGQKPWEPDTIDSDLVEDRRDKFMDIDELDD